MSDLAHRYHRVLEQIRGAVQTAGRSDEDVKLIAVSKTHPIESVRVLADLGQRDFGENKVQELTDKAADGSHVRWHMIGHLQRNKAKFVARHADAFHALDSLRLGAELQKRCEQEGRMLDCFVEVNVSQEDTKFGLHPAEVHGFIDRLSEFDRLRIVGLMTLASYHEDAEAVRPQFRRMRELQESYTRSGNPNATLEFLSMGMTNDFPVAIEEGATHIRIGTAIFGARN